MDGAVAGLCADCAHARPLTSARGSVFWRCARSVDDPRFPKYPRLPVLRCQGFEPQEREPVRRR
jgi:hypothetical protein